MSMPLEQDIPLEEILWEKDQFDYLTGVRELVLRAKEFHADDMQDAEYCYLFWVRPDDEHVFITRVQSNIKTHEAIFTHWNFDMNWNGTGLVFMRVFL